MIVGPDRFQNLTESSLSEGLGLPFPKWTFIHNFPSICLKSRLHFFVKKWKNPSCIQARPNQSQNLIDWSLTEGLLFHKNLIQIHQLLFEMISWQQTLQTVKQTDRQTDKEQSHAYYRITYSLPYTISCWEEVIRPNIIDCTYRSNNFD